MSMRQLRGGQEVPGPARLGPGRVVLAGLNTGLGAWLR